MKKIQIPNRQGESLDTWTEGEGEGEVKAVVVLAHGIGTDKHETTGQFDDITNGLLKESYAVVRFDFSGFGESEGRSEDFDFQKGARDLESVLDYTKENFDLPIYLISQSMATAITCYLQPGGVEKIIFTAHVNPDGENLVKGLQDRIRSREGGEVNENGISIYPRSSGESQKFGSSLWSHIRRFNFVEKCKELGEKTNLLLIRPKQDQIVTGVNLSLFRDQKEFSYVEIDGDHSFSGSESREQLVEQIIHHFN